MSEVPLGKTFNIVFSFGDDGGSAADIRRSKIRAKAGAMTAENQKVFQLLHAARPVLQRWGHGHFYAGGGGESGVHSRVSKARMAIRERF